MKNPEVQSGFARVYAAQPGLPHAHKVTIECDIVRGLHAFTVVGLPDKAVEESKDRIAAAIKNCGYESPKRSNKKIVLSLAPANVKKEGGIFDLPLSIAFLKASGQVTAATDKMLFVGELGLDGTVRPVAGTISVAALAQKHGFSVLVVPEENADEAALISGLTVYPVAHLKEALSLLSGKKATRHIHKHAAASDTEDSFDIIRGQEHAKRALTIAAAGMHNIALYGPPGTGKTLLARACAAVLPDLNEDEMIEVTTIHSLVREMRGALWRPPFRSPHHTASYASLIGGGSGSVRPGEVTLAHRGILFLDEFPEFRRDVIQALREPMEDGVVSIARAAHNATYPAQFMMVAALNPCPCGYWGSARCECMPHTIEKYRRKISGPIADRIDVWVSVQEMPVESLSLQKKRVAGETVRVRESIHAARERQRRRFTGTKLSANAHMTARELETHARLESDAEKQLVDAAKRLKLSPRGYHRTVKLARTIADLAESDTIQVPHMLEALQYRARTL